ncbi:arginine--tRNA ligase [candidate division WWE3 bacterium]|nr:arginine--tRNA ligase [candidate division WWE3 bacterium]
MEIIDIIKKNVASAVEDVYGVEPGEIHVEHPAGEVHGDYSTNVAIVLSKALKQSPTEVAKNICYKLSSHDASKFMNGKEHKIFDKIEFAPPGFINFTLSTEWLQNVLDVIHDNSQCYGISNFGDKKRIALEHSNVNPNKAAHIGHLRNACIGQFVERIYEFLGYEVEVQYYVNDVGVQVATSLMGMQKIEGLIADNYAKFDHFAWDVYAKMESLIAQDPVLAKEREMLMVRLENVGSGENIEIRALAEKILSEQLKTFQKLNIDYDVVIHEADILALDFWEVAYEKLKKNENVYYAEDGPSRGCWLVRMSAKPSGRHPESLQQIEEDKIIVRSNGVPTYTAKDIAYHMWKFGLLEKDFFYEKMNVEGGQKKALWTTAFEPSAEKESVSFTAVDLVFDVIGGEQTYAMSAVKKALEYLGYEKQAQNMTHVNYGFVYLSPATAAKLGIDTSDGKTKYGMSGRKGWGIKVDDFIDMVDDRILGEFGDFPALKDVRNGAIKFEMLKFNTFQDMIFDLDEALNIKGYSGPYLQYTHARARSVLEKGQALGFRPGRNKNEGPGPFSDLPGELSAQSMILDEKELNVLHWIHRYPEVVEASAFEFAPNHLCTFLFELARRYNLVYNDLSILNAETEEKRNFRLLLTSCVADVLKSGLCLLGINAPAKI